MYDGDGGRVVKEVTSDQRTVTRTTYIGSLYEEENEAGSSKIEVRKKHIFAGSNRICSIQLQCSSLEPRTYYYHSDHLGSSNIITDAQGKLLQHCEYTPYGSIARNEGTDIAKHKFTGKELDSTGLYFYGARYYDPQSLNRYSYCRNNPINLVDPTGHKWSWEKFWHAAVGAIVGIALTIVLGPAGFGMSMAMAGMIGGATGGAITGGLEGGWQGALIGAGIGSITGGVGGWAIAGGHTLVLGGMFAAGVGMAAATNSWDSFAGGFVGGLCGAAVGGGIVNANKEQFANYRAGNGFVSNRDVAINKAFLQAEAALDIDEGGTVSRCVTDKSTREWQVKSTVRMYKQYGSGQIKNEIQRFELKGGIFRYNENYGETGRYFENNRLIEFGQGNWENPWPGYHVGRQGLERTFPHEIYHFTQHESYSVEEPLAHSYAFQEREILRQNRGW